MKRGLFSPEESANFHLEDDEQGFLLHREGEAVARPSPHKFRNLRELRASKKEIEQLPRLSIESSRSHQELSLMTAQYRATLFSPSLRLVLSNISMVCILITIGLIAWKLDGADGLTNVSWFAVLSPLVGSVVCENLKFYSEQYYPLRDEGEFYHSLTAHLLLQCQLMLTSIFMIAYMIEHPETSRLIGFAPDLLLIITWAIVFIYFLPGLMDPENLIDSRYLFLAA